MLDLFGGDLVVIDFITGFKMLWNTLKLRFCTYLQ